MPDNKFKWTTTNTKQLINTVHREDFVLQFQSTEGKPRPRARVWEHIRDVFDASLSSQEIKNKYNQVYMIYKKELDEYKRSGTDESTWKYWNVFHKTFPKKSEKRMEEDLIQELGSGAEMRLEADDNTIEQPKKQRKTPNTVIIPR